MLVLTYNVVRRTCTLRDEVRYVGFLGLWAGSRDWTVRWKMSCNVFGLWWAVTPTSGCCSLKWIWAIGIGADGSYNFHLHMMMIVGCAVAIIRYFVFSMDHSRRQTQIHFEETSSSTRVAAAQVGSHLAPGALVIVPAAAVAVTLR